jgi:membrane protein implicated in regulation of membrane protease activity
MIDYINNNLSGFWIAVGFTMLAAEVLLFGFTTIVFFFGGLGAVVTGLLLMAGVLPESWIASIACFGIATGIISALLWKPLKKLQNKSAADQKPQSDFVGIKFKLDQAISSSNFGKYRYSGISWTVQIAPDSEVDQIAKGHQVEVVSVDVGVFRVKPAG